MTKILIFYYMAKNLGDKNICQINRDVGFKVDYKIYENDEVYCDSKAGSFVDVIQDTALNPKDTYHSSVPITISLFGKGFTGEDISPGKYILHLEVGYMTKKPEKISSQGYSEEMYFDIEKYNKSKKTLTMDFNIIIKE